MNNVRGDNFGGDTVHYDTGMCIFSKLHTGGEGNCSPEYSVKTVPSSSLLLLGYVVKWAHIVRVATEESETCQIP